MDEAKFIEISAEVLYWEDATVNGTDDDEGKLIPCRKGSVWAPVIDLDTGRIIDWPLGTDAEIYYKVCDQGHYWLLDENKQRIAKWKDDYVPDDILCIGENGYGDYIIFEVGADGKILNWRKRPEIDEDKWQRSPAS